MSAFSGLKEKIVEFYQSKNESEQRLLLVLSIVVPVFLVFSVYSKISGGLLETQEKLSKQLELNQWAGEQISIIESARRSGGSNAQRQGSITQIINSTARRFSITIERIQPQKTDAVKIGIDEVGFNKLMQWLQELETRHGIKASNIDFSKADTSGLVKIRRLDLERN